MSDQRIIVALDFPGAKEALGLADCLDPSRCRVKVGKTLFTGSGPDVVRSLVNAGFDVFLDLKFHDIPNTVAMACRAAADLGVWMLNVHALGGRRMMETARAALENQIHRPHLVAVTLLTSLDAEEILATGLSGTPEENVLRLARLAADSGLDGVVCSPQELRGLREQLPPEFLLITPGIRPQGSALGDQKRVMAPVEALKTGADYLVIGRPITRAEDPVGVLDSIEAEIAAAVR